jgi:rhodanese-related sulfurtransferase
MTSWEIQPRDLAAALRSARPPRLLDVRQPDEHSLVSLPGAKLVPLAELPTGLGELQAWKGDVIVVYCHHGVRSLRATQFLRQAGFTQAVSLAGGIDRWADEVEPHLPRY